MGAAGSSYLPCSEAHFGRANRDMALMASVKSSLPKPVSKPDPVAVETMRLAT